MPHEFFAKHPTLQAYFQNVNTFNAHAREIKAALTEFLLESKNFNITFNINELISAHDQLTSEPVDQNKKDLRNVINNMEYYHPELLDIMLTCKSYGDVQKDLQNKNSEFYNLLWTPALRIQNRMRLQNNVTETTLEKFKENGKIDSSIIVFIDYFLKSYFDAKAKLAPEEQAKVINATKIMLSANKNLKHIELLPKVLRKDCNDPFRKLMNNQSLTADEINRLHDTLDGIKHVPTFDDYLKSIGNKNFDKKNTNLTYLYEEYIKWLINTQQNEVPVHDLLYNIRIISMYVSHSLNGTPYTPIDIVIYYMQNQAIFNSDVKTYVSNRYPAKSGRMTNKAFIGLMLLGVLSALFISSGFSPDFNTAAAITQWTIGAAFGAAFSSLAVISLVKRWANPAPSENASAALDIAVEKISHRLFLPADQEAESVIRSTLSATTNKLILSRGTYDSKGTFVNASENYTPYRVDLKKIW